MKKEDLEPDLLVKDTDSRIRSGSVKNVTDPEH